MLLNMFIFSCIAAVFFFVTSKRFYIKWVKKSFILYGCLFVITTGITGCALMNDQRDPNVSSSSNDLKYQQTVHSTESSSVNQQQIIQNVPLIPQLPELPRGCEVTSLAMLLQYYGVDVDKMELATKIKKDPTPYEKKENKIYFGNPHDGFVGDMYSFDNPGLGVYHGPIATLAMEYVGSRVKDFTGDEFKIVLNHLDEQRPVWVIINATYKKLSEDEFITWNTPNGPEKITMHEHSVVVTGYDDLYVYFNDPLNKRSKAPIKDFEEAWVQMGKQAITVY